MHSVSSISVALFPGPSHIFFTKNCLRIQDNIWEWPVNGAKAQWCVTGEFWILESKRTQTCTLHTVTGGYDFHNYYTNRNCRFCSYNTGSCKMMFHTNSCLQCKHNSTQMHMITSYMIAQTYCTYNFILFWLLHYTTREPLLSNEARCNHVLTRRPLSSKVWTDVWFELKLSFVHLLGVLWHVTSWQSETMKCITIILSAAHFTLIDLDHMVNNTKSLFTRWLYSRAPFKRTNPGYFSPEHLHETE